MKEFIKNRKEQKVAVQVAQAANQKGLAVIMHGLGGNKDQLHLQTVAEVFLRQGFTVVRFDTTNTFGESEGDYEDATTTNYLEDLEDVIAWAGGQSWYRTPFYLMGHSLGGVCVGTYAERFPQRMKGLILLSSVVSGELSTQSKKYRGEVLRAWKETGWHEKVDPHGSVQRLKWSHMEDRMKYDLCARVDALTMPALMIVGAEDDSTPPEHQKILFEKIKSAKEFHIIPGAPHTFKDSAHLAMLKKIIREWLEKVEKG